MDIYLNHAKGLASEIVSRGIKHRDVGPFIVVEAKVFIPKTTSPIFEYEMSVIVADTRTEPYRHIWSRSMHDRNSKVFRHDRPMFNDL